MSPAFTVMSYFAIQSALLIFSRPLWQLIFLCDIMITTHPHIHFNGFYRSLCGNRTKVTKGKCKMQFRDFGKTGVKVSTLGFGCMRLPVIGGATENIDEGQTAKLFSKAFELGVNYWDTAYPYHGYKSEEVTGRVLGKGGIKNDVFIATKLPTWLAKDKADLPRLLDEQLKKLGRDYIDFYLMHNPDTARWPALQSADMQNFIDKAKRDGKIRFAGFSLHDNIHHFKTVLDSYAWDFCQLQYNYLDVYHQAGKEGVDLAKERGVGLVIMEPLKGGRLATGLPDDIAARLKKENPDCSAAEWALRFVLNDDAVSIALSGMNSMEQLLENVEVATAASCGNLSAGELEMLSEVRESYLARQKVGCTSCMYCMPCPMGVDIAASFSRYNAYFATSDEGAKEKMKASFLSFDEQSGPSKCVKCMECISKCPQAIAIPTQLENCASTFAK